MGKFAANQFVMTFPNNESTYKLKPLATLAVAETNKIILLI